MKNEPYHYTESWLDYVWLANGFTRHDTPDGSGVSITAADQLHDVIARAIVTSEGRIGGQDVRFLRSMLGISQAGLGDILGLSRASVARWEGAFDEPISETADRVLRLYFALTKLDDETAHEVRALLDKIDDLKAQLTLEENAAGQWMKVAA